MPISGIFFVPLHHQSKRKTMFKKTDPNPQLDMFTAPVMQLGNRASRKYSDPNAWHNQFYSLVTTKIDEEIFKPSPNRGQESGGAYHGRTRPVGAISRTRTSRQICSGSRSRVCLQKNSTNATTSRRPCSSTASTHAMARPDTGVCSSTASMHTADACG